MKRRFTYINSEGKKIYNVILATARHEEVAKSIVSSCVDTFGYREASYTYLDDDDCYIIYAPVSFEFYITQA